MVGIIANPASGKDIRRLVAQGTVFDNMEKVNIIQRILVVLHHAGIDDVCMMPDSFGIMEKAMSHLARNLKIEVHPKALEFVIHHTQEDSATAAKMLREMGASCIITLGGDGTNRAVAKACGDVPLIPMSTGTNNVFPKMLEGTVVGMAAVVAEKDADGAMLKTTRCKKLEIHKNGEIVDIALIDAAVTDDRFVGARALWDGETIRELYVTMAKADSIGMSAIAGSFYPISEYEPKGLYIQTGKNEKFTTWAAIAPGLMCGIPILDDREMQIGESIPLVTPEGMIALDGEREVFFCEDDRVEVKLTDTGPLVVEVPQTLAAAAAHKFFIQGGGVPGTCFS